MIVVEKILEIRAKLNAHFGKKIAFVPTMGALHDGHLALITKARELADIVVVSIFVNKLQFNDQKDFEKYPKQIIADLEKLKIAGVNYVFYPSDEEVFPADSSFSIVLTSLTNCLCGIARVGHFEGVALIVTKLFNIIKPDIAIFGQKDFQQLQVIKKLVQDFNFDIEIVGHEIVREASGLAMSSRNQRLDAASKIKAANIYRILLEIKKEILNGEKNIANLLQKKGEELLEIGFEKLDYLEIRNEVNLKLVTNFDDKKQMRIFIAVYLSGIRLIDNLSIN